MIYTPVLMDSIQKVVNWYKELPILAYGELSDEFLIDAFQTILQWKADDHFISDTIPDNLYTATEYWLLLGLLSKYIDYGSSPRGGWLTEEGEEVLNILKTVPRSTCCGAPVQHHIEGNYEYCPLCYERV